MDFKLELVTVPVSDVDRAKAFYADKAGFNADHDFTVSDEIRFVHGAIEDPTAVAEAARVGLLDRDRARAQHPGAGFRPGTPARRLGHPRCA